MLPSRGLRPAHFTSLTSRQILHSRVNGSRKISSLPRTSLPATARRTNSLQAATRKTGVISPPNGLSTASSVRYASWYAPWSWGSSSTPSTNATPSASASDFAAQHRPPPEPPAVEAAVTTNTPELAPAGIDAPAVVDSTVSPGVMSTVEELLAKDAPVKLPSVDPSLTIDHYGHLKELGLDYGWGPSAFFQYLIEHVHLMTGLGWGPSLVACTVLLRTCLFYFQAQGSDNMGKLAAMKPVLQDLQRQTEDAIKNGNKEKEQLYKMKQQQIGKEIGVKLGKGFGGPFMLGMFGFGAWRCLSGMSHLPVPGMSEAGFLWFTDLTVADPYYALPALTGAIMWTVMKTGGETGLHQETAQASQQKMVQNILPVIMTAVTMFQPAGIQFYFFCSTILGGITGRMLRNASVRKFLKISPLPTAESQKAFSKIIEEKQSLKMLRGRDGKIIYQAPTTPSSNIGNKSGQIRGLTLKQGTKVPMHFAPVLSEKERERLDLEKDFKKGMPKTDRTTWVRKHYTPGQVWQRLRTRAMGEKKEVVTEEEASTPKVVKPKVDPEVERRKKFQNRGKK